jgi:hypothetical protein
MVTPKQLSGSLWITTGNNILLPPLPTGLSEYAAQGADRQIFSRMGHSDNAAVRMSELVMAALTMNRMKALGLEPFDNVGIVHDV